MKGLLERIPVAVLSYPGPEHREFLQCHLEGIAMALESIEYNSFEILYRDVLPNEQSISTVLAELDQRGVVAILGPFDSETADLLIPRAHDLGLPVLSTGATSPLLNSGNLAGTTFFRLGGSDIHSLNQLVDWLVTEKPLETVLAIAEHKTAWARYGDDQLVVFKRLAFERSLSLAPLRFERGHAENILEECKRMVFSKTPRIGAAVLFGYSTDEIEIAQTLRSIDPTLEVYTINPKRELFERTKLEGLRAVASDFEYSSSHRIEIFRKQFAGRFSHAQPHDFHASALCAYDLVQILNTRIHEIDPKARTDVRKLRGLLLKRLRESHDSVKSAIVSDGIFTSNQELSFHCRNIVLCQSHFVEYYPTKGVTVDSKRLKELLARGWEKYRHAVERFGFVKHNVDMWAFLLLLIILFGTSILWLKSSVLDTLRQLREWLHTL